MEIKKLLETLHPLERKVLPLLEKTNSFDEIVKQTSLKEVEVMRALQWLQNKGIVYVKEDVKEIVELGKNGKIYAEKGFPEKMILRLLLKKSAPVQKLLNGSGLEKNEFNSCLGVLKKKLGIEINKGNVSITGYGKKMLREETLEEKFVKRISTEEVPSGTLKDEERFVFENLRSRKDVLKLKITKTKDIHLSDIGKKAVRLKISDKNVVDTLTSEMLKKGTWKGKKFRRYDIKAEVPSVYGGKRHFESEVVEYAKKIWIEMGFTEMTGNFVQTSFWDLDTLFVPQDHPARAMQDTFYIKKPAKGKLPKKLAAIVKKVHENGGDTGSKGWQAPWSEEIAKENVLRTHTTVLSAQALSKLRKEDLPAKFFSVGKVFRNETLDWKHLFEFYQMEGIVVDPNANLRNLIGYLKEFFGKMGYKDVRIRPAHFPYTEPSAEIDVLVPEKEEWVELGGCGIFRPEVTKPLMGFECPVLAWGLGLGRIILPYYRITDLRDLNKNDLKQLREIKKWLK